MNLSFSTIALTIISVSVLICIMQIIIHKTETIKSVSYHTLFFISLLILIRLVTPFEWTFTKTINITIILPTIYKVIFTQQKILFNLAPIDLLKLIWGIGVAYKCFNLIKNFKIFCLIIKNSENQLNKYIKKFPILSNQHLKGIYFIKNLPYPFVIYPFNPIICLPKAKYDNIELENIFIHEMQHIKNKDIWIKTIVECISIIYWFFPLIYLFKNQINTLMELRVDNQITSNMSFENRYKYIQSLISVSRKSSQFQKQNSALNLSAQFTVRKKNILSKRIYFNLDTNTRTKKIIIPLLIFVALWITSPTFIIEPYKPYENREEITFNEHEIKNNFYIMKLKNAFYLVDKKTNKIYSEIQNPNTHPFNKLIIKEG